MLEKITLTDTATFLISFLITYISLSYYPKALEKNLLQRRLKRLHLRGESWEEEPVDQEIPLNNFLQKLINFFQQISTHEIGQVRQLLYTAGWRNRQSLGIFFLAKFGLIGIFIFAALTYALQSDLYLQEPLLALTLLVLSGAGAFRLPNLIVEFIASKRRTKLEQGIPDMLDMMVICTDAGLGSDGMIERVSGEMGTINRPLAEELNLLLIELMFTSNRTEAIMNLYKRTGVKAIQMLATTLIQSEKYGTALSQSLKTIAAEARQNRMMAAEEKAARLPATLTVPLITLILPCLFIVILGPIFITLR